MDEWMDGLVCRWIEEQKNGRIDRGCLDELQVASFDAWMSNWMDK